MSLCTFCPVTLSVNKFPRNDFRDKQTEPASFSNSDRRLFSAAPQPNRACIPPSPPRAATFSLLPPPHPHHSSHESALSLSIRSSHPCPNRVLKVHARDVPADVPVWKP
eukprot:3799124-Rhodomonas_salina.3